LVLAIPPRFVCLRRRLRNRRRIQPAHSGDLERSIRSIMNTDSGDHEHPLALAWAVAGERHVVTAGGCH
jgi:hypothetical protein